MSRKIRTRVRLGEPPEQPDGDHDDPTYRDHFDDYMDDRADWQGWFRHFVKHANFRERLWFALTREAWITVVDYEDDDLEPGGA